MDAPIFKIEVPPSLSIPVEESRAQRLQRQQARFRDRGGIFVPSTRNTLIDILLGRKAESPKKNKLRGASRSPVKAEKRHPREDNKTTAFTTSRRTSPRKAAQRSPSKGKEGEENVATAPVTQARKSTGRSTKKSTVSSKSKATTGEERPAPKRRGRPPKIKPVESDRRTTAGSMETRAKGSDYPLHSKPKNNSQTPKNHSINQPAVKELTDDPGKGSIVDCLASDGAPTKLIPSSKTRTSSEDNPDGRALKESESIKRRSRRAITTKAKKVYNELSDDNNGEYLGEDLIPPNPLKNAALLHKKSKGTNRKGKAHLAPVVPPENGYHPARELSNLEKTSRKCVLPDARVRETGEVVIGTIQCTRKGHRASVEVDTDQPIRAQASSEISEQSTPELGEIKVPSPEVLSTSKKRPREKGHGDLPVENSGVAQIGRKRPKTNVSTDDRVPDGMVNKQTSPRNKNNYGKNEAEGRVEKAGNSDPPMQSKPTSTKVKRLSKTKVKGPPKKVLARVKKPLPPIEDDNPDPINFLS